MKSNWLYAVCGLLLVGTGVLFGVNRGWFASDPEPSQVMQREQEREAANQAKQPVLRDPNVPPHEGWKKVGGVWRPPTDVVATNKPAGDKQRQPTPLPDPGRSPMIDKGASPQAASIGEALESGKHMERLNPFVAPPEFDKQAFLADPESYLNEHVPGRAFQSAQPGEGVKPIKRVSSFYTKVLQGETVVLKAQGEPGMPITFYAPRLGVFEKSKTSSISVMADEQGIATARYQATGGTHGDTPIVAASPVNSKQTRFMVNVLLPKDRVVNAGGDQ